MAKKSNKSNHSHHQHLRSGCSPFSLSFECPNIESVADCCVPMPMPRKSFSFMRVHAFSWPFHPLIISIEYTCKNAVPTSKSAGYTAPIYILIKRSRAYFEDFLFNSNNKQQMNHQFFSSKNREFQEKLGQSFWATAQFEYCQIRRRIWKWF